MRRVLFVLVLVACKKTVGDVRTVDVVGDSQGSPASPAKVSLTLTAGELHLTPGGAHTVGGSVRSNVKDLDPKIDAAADHVKITQGEPGVDPTPYGADLTADWRLTIGPSPIDLAIDAGAAKTQLELGGLALKSVHVKTTTGAVDLGFAQANPLAADDIDIDTGGGTVTLTGAGAFGASKIHVHAGVGAITIDLGSKVEKEVLIDVEATAGSVTIKVPQSVTARAMAVGQVATTGWTKDGDGYVLGGATPSPRVNVKAKSGTGTTTLLAVP